MLLDVWFLSQSATRWLAHRAEGSPFSPDEFAFCSVLRPTDGATLSQLAEFTGMPLSTASTMTARLKDRGLLESAPHPSDGRARNWRLTDDGRAQLEAADARFARAYHQLVGGIAADTSATARLGVVVLDELLRADLGIPARERAASLATETDPLTAAEQAELRTFEAWLRHRRSQR